jgi:hypothetical protein
VVGEAACSGGGRTTFARACQRRRVHRCSISCDSIRDEAIAPYWGEPSGVFDLAESPPPGPRSRFHHFAPDESAAMAFARTFDKERSCSKRSLQIRQRSVELSMLKKAGIAGLGRPVDWPMFLLLHVGHFASPRRG